MKNLILALAATVGLTAAAETADASYLVKARMYGTKQIHTHCPTKARAYERYLEYLGFNVRIRRDAGHYDVLYRMYGTKTRRFVSHARAHAFEAKLQKYGARAQVIHLRRYMVRYHMHGTERIRMHCPIEARRVARRLESLGFHSRVRRLGTRYYVLYHMHGSKTRTFTSHSAAHAFERQVERYQAHARVIHL